MFPQIVSCPPGLTGWAIAREAATRLGSAPGSAMISTISASPFKQAVVFRHCLRCVAFRCCAAPSRTEMIRKTVGSPPGGALPSSAVSNSNRSQTISGIATTSEKITARSPAAFST